MGVIGAALTCVLAAALAEPLPTPEALPPGTLPPGPLPALAQPPVNRPIEPLGPPTTDPYLLRTAIEGGIAFGLSVLWYYHDSSLSVKDIDYNWSLETWKKRFITYQAVRFD